MIIPLFAGCMVCILLTLETRLSAVRSARAAAGGTKLPLFLLFPEKSFAYD
jgi:hypothetical protein